MAIVRVSKGIQQGKILVSFSHDPKFVAKVKTIENYRRHSDKILELSLLEGHPQKILRFLKNENIQLGFHLTSFLVKNLINRYQTKLKS